MEREPAEGTERDDYGQSAKAVALVEHCRKLIRRTKANDPMWRKKGQQGIDYYFGKQWEEEDARIVRERGQDPIVNNQIKPGIRALIGLMLAQPYDWLALPVGANDDHAAERITAGLKALANVNRVSDLLRWFYWWGLCYGVGVGLVGPYVRWDDPRREVCQIRLVDAREVGWDPDSRETDGSDVRFLRWSRKIDLADAKRKWPRLDPDRVAVADDTDAQEGESVTVNSAPIDETPPPSMWDDFSEWNHYVDDGEIDREAKKVTVHEVWEYRHEKVWLIDQGAGPVEFEGPDTPAGVTMIADPTTRRYWKDTVKKPWRHVVCGPLLLESARSIQKHDRIPFVFYFYDRDGHGNPVSAIESLKDMQREENYRRAKMLYELGNQPVIVSPEVANRMGMTLDQLAQHAGKRSPVWIANPGEVVYPPTGNLASQQFELMQHSEIAIQKILGTNDHLMGYDTPAESGKSKELSMQQGATIQRDAEAALRAFHKAMGELLLSDMCQFHTDEWLVRITDQLGQPKTFVLNGTTVDPTTGATVRVNDINQYRYDIELETTPYSPTARMRAAERIVSLYQNEEDPNVRRALRRMAITLDNLPNKADLLQTLDQAEQAMQQAAQQPPVQPKPPLEAINLSGDQLTPYEVGQVLQSGGIQPDPSRQPGQAPVGAQGEPPAQVETPGPDPAKLAALDLDAQKHAATLEHQAAEAERKRQHDADMALLNHELSMQKAEHQQAITPPPKPDGSGASS